MDQKIEKLCEKFHRIFQNCYKNSQIDSIANSYLIKELESSLAKTILKFKDVETEDDSISSFGDNIPTLDQCIFLPIPPDFDQKMCITDNLLVIRSETNDADCRRIKLNPDDEQMDTIGNATNHVIRLASTGNEFEITCKIQYQTANATVASEVIGVVDRNFQLLKEADSTELGDENTVSNN
jgi:hypothetical protein